MDTSGGSASHRFIIADMPVEKLNALADKDYVVRLDTAEKFYEWNTDLATHKIHVDDVWDLGYDGTGVAMICERAQVSKGAFYHHFDTKQAIFLALMQQWLEGLDHQLDAFRRPCKVYRRVYTR